MTMINLKPPTTARSIQDFSAKLAWIRQEVQLRIACKDASRWCKRLSWIELSASQVVNGSVASV